MKLDPPSEAKPQASGGRGEAPSGLERFPTLQGRPGFQPIELIEKLPWAEKEQARATWAGSQETLLGLRRACTSATYSWKARSRAWHPRNRGSPMRWARNPATSEGGMMPVLEMRLKRRDSGPAQGPRSPGLPGSSCDTSSQDALLSCAPGPPDPES